MAVNDTVSTLRAEQLDVVGYALDVADRAGIARSMDTEGRVDVVVCAAGVYKPRSFDQVTDEDFRHTLEVNLIGVFIPAQEGARRMREEAGSLRCRRAAH